MDAIINGDKRSHNSTDQETTFQISKIIMKNKNFLVFSKNDVFHRQKTIFLQKLKKISKRIVMAIYHSQKNQKRSGYRSVDGFGTENKTGVSFM